MIIIKLFIRCHTIKQADNTKFSVSQGDKESEDRLSASLD